MPLEYLVWLVLFVLLLLGTPVFVAIGVATVAVLVQSNIPLTIIPLDLYKVSEMFPLLAVPAFVLAGAFMEKGGMAGQIVEVASMFVGRIRGGLGIVTILGCMFFAAMIGSGPGTVAAMGSLMIPSMIRKGYKPEYAAGVSATGGTLGILIPPSNPMIIYGVIANLSVSSLFMAGFVPGLIVGAMLIFTAYIMARRAGYQGTSEIYNTAEKLAIMKRSVWSLMAPVIILGVIYLGICTPVEASTIAVFYSLFVGVVITKKLKWDEIWDSIKITNATIAILSIVVGVSLLFGRFLTMYQVPQKLAQVMLGFSSNPFIILSLIVLLLFFLGMFMETLATIVILAPILLPVVIQVGIDPYFFGIIWVMTNEVAMLTPPLGVNLFIAMSISGLSLERVAIGAFPFMMGIIVIIFIFMAFPEIVLFLPRLLGQM
ncbi:MAG: C4-dicarboxylate ABC transporter permease [Peptococcaceae bacterium BICA1-8]|nr:MAG: C4-dicarboxylate ABC transporter permease [Peptococcaceae bacterium BICA1-8]